MCIKKGANVKIGEFAEERMEVTKGKICVWAEAVEDSKVYKQS